MCNKIKNDLHSMYLKDAQSNQQLGLVLIFMSLRFNYREKHFKFKNPKTFLFSVRVKTALDCYGHRKRFEFSLCNYQGNFINKKCFKSIYCLQNLPVKDFNHGPLRLKSSLILFVFDECSVCFQRSSETVAFNILIIPIREKFFQINQLIL